MRTCVCEDNVTLFICFFLSLDMKRQTLGEFQNKRSENNILLHFDDHIQYNNNISTSVQT